MKRNGYFHSSGRKSEAWYPRSHPGHKRSLGGKSLAAAGGGAGAGGRRRNFQRMPVVCFTSRAPIAGSSRSFTNAIARSGRLTPQT